MKIKKIMTNLAIVSSIAFFTTGCSLSNPFGIGYDSSVCNDSKTFGVCGSPKDIYKYKDKIKAVQNNYLKARLDTTLYFGVSPEGIIQVKSERDANWERYSTSEWKKIIDEKEHLNKSNSNREASFNMYSNQNDIPITKGGDLSVVYKEQGPLLVTRTKIGNIIRDQGLIQEVFIANYADTEGDLISSHNVYVVVKDPDWIVGEKTPKAVNIEDIPTPLSTELLKKQQVVEESQEKTISNFNRDRESGYMSAQEEESKLKEDKIENLNVINNFINTKK